MRQPRATRLIPLLAILAACDAEDDPPPAYDASVPVPEVESIDTAALERARYDTSWRRHADHDRRLRLHGRPPPDGAVPDPAPPDGTAPDGIAPDGLPPDGIAPDRRLPPPRPAPALPVAPPDETPRPARPGDDGHGRPAALLEPATAGPVPEGASILHVQVLLDRLDFSPGAIDGNWGQNTEKAVYWFQHEEGLEPTGRVDADTFRRLVRRADHAPATAVHEVEQDDVDGPFRTLPAGIYAKAELDCLCYESALEQLAERFHATPGLLRRLNPDRDLDALEAGTRIRVPNTRRRGVDDPPDVERIVISRRGAYTHALDGDGRIVFHFPSTLGSRYAPSPTGEYHVAALVRWPRFHYTPDLYHDVPDRRPETVLPPGPNSPIGGTWIQLSKPNYGIHGTAAPSTIGYVNSHGCVRLTNWDARALARHVRNGTPIEFR